jgi:Dolichyl-phosphate-mannose-protein mannosyltransferase
MYARMPTGIPIARARLSSRWRWYAMLAVVVAIGAAYRFPGVSWGFDFYPFDGAHPDEGVACLNAMMRGVPEMKNNDLPTERGMMFQCLVLGLVFKPHDLASSARIGRAYSVIWGLISIVLTALIARRLKGEVAAIFAALLLCTSGIHLITSFWARGQVQTVTLSLASMLVALRVRAAGERAVVFLFVASAFAGAAIATRWNVALVPMLLACSLARGPIFLRLAATGAGGLLGFFGSTGFFWTPDMIAANLEMQTNNLVNLYSRIGPFVTGCAALVCIVAATGLVTFLMAAWFCIGRARRLRNFPLEDLTWSNLRSKLDSPGVIIGVPTAITFVMLCFNKHFDARYTDLFAPPLAIAAGVRMADLWQNIRWRFVLAALVAYQGVYAASMLARYVNDPRKSMNVALDKAWQPRGRLYTTGYAGDPRLESGYAVDSPWKAEWIMASDLAVGQYLTASGTFRFLKQPTSCREILYCDGEEFRKLVQQVYARDGWDQVYVSKAAAWTPEIKLHHALMTSKWLFTGDIRLFRKRAQAKLGPILPSVGAP